MCSEDCALYLTYTITWQICYRIYERNIKTHLH
jgi:hypothetical protein